MAASAGLRAGRGWTRSGPPRSPDEEARAADAEDLLGTRALSRMDASRATNLLGSRALSRMDEEAAEVLMDARAPSRMDVEAILG